MSIVQGDDKKLKKTERADPESKQIFVDDLQKISIVLISLNLFLNSLNNTKEGKKERVKSLLVDARVTLNGGQRYTPIYPYLSTQAGFPVFDETRTNELQYPDYFRADFRIAFKVSTKKVTQEWAIDLRNVTNHQNLFTQEFDVATGEFRDTYQIGFLPIGQWRITF